MRAAKVICGLMPLALGLAVCLPGLAETAEQVQQRLEQYRQLDAEAERRREETRQWQEQRRREEYARRWKQYGDEEIDFLRWRQQRDGTWVTEYKMLPPSLKGSHSSLGSWPQSPAIDRLWVKVRSSVSIEELALALSQDESRLAKLNNVEEDHHFQSGDWLVLPSQSSRQVKQLAAVDTSQLRRTPPLEALPEPQETARVRFGDSLVKIAQRYNLTIAELLRLNPGLEAARLVVGTQIRTARSTPSRSSMILGLKPTASGGLSWPDQSGISPSVPSYSAEKLIGVNCTSLMINRKPAYQNWGSWNRPPRGSSDEQLVIDRCTTLKP